MRPNLHITGRDKNDEPIQPAIPFKLGEHNDFTGSAEVVDDVLRTLDRLSISLDELRREVEALEDESGPGSAA